MRMTLDLLHEFANTEVFCLFHNCTWQSRYSDINVYFLALFDKPMDRSLSTGLPVLNLTCVYVFCLRLCLDLNVQQTLAHNCQQVSLCNRLDYKARLTAWSRAVGGGTRQQRQKRKECLHLNPTPGACPEGTKQWPEQPHKPTLITTDVATPDVHDQPTPEALPWLWPWPTD